MPCSPIVCAALGGLAVPVLELAELHNTPTDQRPDLTDPWYWIRLPLLSAIAAGLAYAYVNSGIDLKPILAANVGISAPLIIRSMAQLNPINNRIDPGKGA